MGTGRPEKETTQGPQASDRVTTRHTLLKQERIRRRKDFLAAYYRGTKSAHGGLTLHALATGHTWTRLGLSVGARVGCAVERNRIKRRLREIFRLCKHELKPSTDLVITVRREAAGRSTQQLRQSFQTLIERLHLRRPGAC